MAVDESGFVTAFGNEGVAPGPLEGLASFFVDFPNIPASKLEVIEEVAAIEIILGESLLTPGLQTSVKFHSYLNTVDESLTPQKIFEIFKGTPIEITIKRPILAKFNPPYKDEMKLNQTIYRLGGRSSSSPNSTDDRKMVNRSVEELVLHACDPTLLMDAASLVSKSWKCTTPSQVTRDVLTQCAGARNLKIEESCCARDYIAENIHPFQVVTQQANAALADGGNDPSFVHYMTYENAESGQGTHRFESLFNMAKQPNIMNAPLEYSEVGTDYNQAHSIMNYMFPCDFDLLSDILNGVGPFGDNINSLALFNPAIKQFSLLGNQARGCGIGGAVHKVVKSNIGSAQNENSCPDYAYLFAQKRQARMGLLEKDKIALRIIVPWNPRYHAGKVITVHFINNEALKVGKRKYNYGTGNYLIVSMTHNVKLGGLATTTLDCVSQSVSRGEV